MTDLTKYYKYVEPAAPSPIPSGAELVAFEHRGFLISRMDTEYLHWSVRTVDGGLPPLDLRGSFTTKSKAAAHIDGWWQEEEKRKEAAK